MFSQNNWEETKQAYISKHTSESENKVNLIMIREGEKWHYLDYNEELRQKRKIIITVSIVLIHLEQKRNPSHMKMWIKFMIIVT